MIIVTCLWPLTAIGIGFVDYVVTCEYAANNPFLSDSAKQTRAFASAIMLMVGTTFVYAVIIGVLGVLWFATKPDKQN